MGKKRDRIKNEFLSLARIHIHTLQPFLDNGMSD